MKVAQLWQRFVCFLIGIRVTVTGAPADDRPLLLLSNHNSWLDIPILAGVAPVSFIAKKEVAGWPVVGFLARAQRSVFVDRTRRQATGAHADEVAEPALQGRHHGALRRRHVERRQQGAAVPLGAGRRGADARSATAAPRRCSRSPSPTRKCSACRSAASTGRSSPGTAAPILLPHLKRVLSEGGIDVHVVFGPARTALRRRRPQGGDAARPARWFAAPSRR